MLGATHDPEVPLLRSKGPYIREEQDNPGYLAPTPGWAASERGCPSVRSADRRCRAQLSSASPTHRQGETADQQQPRARGGQQTQHAAGSGGRERTRSRLSGQDLSSSRPRLTDGVYAENRGRTVELGARGRGVGTRYPGALVDQRRDDAVTRCPPSSHPPAACSRSHPASPGTHPPAACSRSHPASPGHSPTGGVLAQSPGVPGHSPTGGVLAQSPGGSPGHSPHPAACTAGASHPAFPGTHPPAACSCSHHRCSEAWAGTRCGPGSSCRCRCCRRTRSRCCGRSRRAAGPWGSCCRPCRRSRRTACPWPCRHRSRSSTGSRPGSSSRGPWCRSTGTARWRHRCCCPRCCSAAAGDTSPDVPAEPEVACERAVVGPLDFFDEVDFARRTRPGARSWPSGPSAWPARSQTPCRSPCRSRCRSQRRRSRRPSEMIIKSSAAITDVVVVSARARSLHGRTMEIPTNPPGPHRGRI